MFGSNLNMRYFLKEFIETICLLLFNDEIHSGIKSISLKLLVILTAVIIPLINHIESEI